MPSRDADVSAQLESLAANVRRRRARLSLTQETFAERAGLDYGWVQKRERAVVDLRIQTLVRISKALDATPASCFGRPSCLRRGAVARQGDEPGRLRSTNMSVLAHRLPAGGPRCAAGISRRVRSARRRRSFPACTAIPSPRTLRRLRRG